MRVITRTKLDRLIGLWILTIGSPQILRNNKIVTQFVLSQSFSSLLKPYVIYNGVGLWTSKIDLSKLDV